MLSGSQIAYFLGVVNTKTNPYFRGVYGIDQLSLIEESLDLNSANIVIVNSDPVASNGQHWLAIFIDTSKPELCCFIDSRAKPPIHYSKEFDKFLNYVTSRYKTLPWSIQGFKTHDCGLFVCMFMHFACIDLSVDYVCNRYFIKHGYAENSIVLKNWFKETFNVSSISRLFSE